MGRRRAQDRGYALMSVYLVIVVLLILAAGVMGYSLTEFQVAQAGQAGAQAFYLAEAGIDRAIAELRQDYQWHLGFADESYGELGTYTVTVGSQGNQRVLTSSGTATAAASPATRTLTAVVRQAIPLNFFDYAIYSSDLVTFNGNSYVVNGDVLSGDADPINNTSHVSGTITTGDPDANPLPRFDFSQLHAIAQGQGNVYDAARLQRVQQHHDQFPTAFWRTPPSDPNDPTTGVPNVVYVTTDLQLNGNIGTIGGFFVVVGDVLSDPDVTEDAVINGNGTVDGPIYTRGTFRINGGAGRLNVTGGVWAGVEARLNGKATVSYNRAYMEALEGLVSADVEMILWREGP